MSPENAIRGFRPKVLNNRLNQTTSGFWRRSSRNNRIELAGSSNDQHRWTAKPSSSVWGEDSSSARMVRLRNGLR
jgi:hypothetical protein